MWSDSSATFLVLFLLFSSACPLPFGTLSAILNTAYTDFTASQVLTVVSSPRLYGYGQVTLVFPFVLLVGSSGLLQRSVDHGQGLTTSLALGVRNLSRGTVT